MTRRRALWLAAGALILAPAAWLGAAWLRFPSDRTPAGAYLRVVKAVNNGRPEDFFAYLEESAQHACFTIRTYRKQARERVLAQYPEPERTRLAEAYAADAEAPDGADVFAQQARQRGWVDRRRRDMSGIAKVEVQGDRATVEAVQGTRYPFRRRENGMWGLTIFTATLVGDAEKAARDAAMIDKAAADYERVRRAEGSGGAADAG